MILLLILGAPLLLSISAFMVRSRVFGVLNSLGYFVVFCASVRLFRDSLVSGQVIDYPGLLRVDTLSAFFILVTAIVGFATALYSVGYIRKDIAAGVISEKKARLYGLFFNLFCLSMFFVPMLENLGFLWAAIEMTTLVSAFLVGFYNTKGSVEAAWKYIIICSVGIVLALLGTVLFSYAFSAAGGAKTLNWSDMAAAAGRMDRNIIKIAFIFVLVGYGTKAGLAPMHTWLPDAHSQAIAPASAMLSGVLLKTSLYAILRFGTIVINAVGFAYFGNLLMIFGLASLFISCAFILVQKDLKRMLAYSSIEHLGIITLGLSIGNAFALAGAFLHIFSHALAKSFMFFGAGQIVGSYHKHNMRSIRGVLTSVPFAGAMLLLGVFALTGLPPFSIFFSEIMIAIGAFSKGAYLAGSAMLLFLGVIFGAFIHNFSRMIFGLPPKEIQPQATPLSIKLSYLVLLIPICIAGIIVPWIKKDLLWIARSLF